MGNCIRHQSSDYDDHYWDDFSSDEEYASCKSFATTPTSSTKSNNNNIDGKTNTTTTTEVKIKITKKQLAELLGKVDVKELRVEQVLAQLLAQSHHHHVFDDVNSLHRHWRPALQSIPEVN